MRRHRRYLAARRVDTSLRRALNHRYAVPRGVETSLQLAELRAAARHRARRRARNTFPALRASRRVSRPPRHLHDHIFAIRRSGRAAVMRLALAPAHAIATTALLTTTVAAASHAAAASLTLSSSAAATSQKRRKYGSKAKGGRRGRPPVGAENMGPKRRGAEGGGPKAR